MEAKRLCSQAGRWRQMHPAAPILSANSYLVHPTNSLNSSPSSTIPGHYFFLSPSLSFLSLNFGFISFTTLHIIILNLNFEALHAINVIMAYVILLRMNIRLFTTTLGVPDRCLLILFFFIMLCVKYRFTIHRFDFDAFFVFVKSY